MKVTVERQHKDTYCVYDCYNLPAFEYMQAPCEQRQLQGNLLVVNTANSIHVFTQAIQAASPTLACPAG